MVLAAALLVLAGGVCALHQDEYGAACHVAPDLCLGMLAVTVAAVALSGQVAVAGAATVRGLPAYAAILLVPDPPPRLTILL